MKRYHFDVKLTAVIEKGAARLFQYEKTRNGRPMEYDKDGEVVYHYATIKAEKSTGRLYCYFSIGDSTRKTWLDTMPRYVVRA